MVRSFQIESFSYSISRLVDLYGEDDNEFAVPLQDADEAEEQSYEKPEEIGVTDKQKSESSTQQSSPTSGKDSHALPAKPAPGSTAAEQISYSAQIARQFSAYNQTPSQERQQRSEIPLPANPTGHNITPAGTSAIATHDSSSTRPSPDRPIRPSEMKDEG